MAEEVFEVTDNGVESVEFIDMDDIEVDADEEGRSILGFLIAAGIGAGAGYGISKLIPKLKAKKLESDKKKLEKLQAKIEKAETVDDVDVDDLEELTPEETEEIKKLEEEAKTNKKSKK